jgi:hypothetical protein
MPPHGFGEHYNEIIAIEKASRRGMGSDPDKPDSHLSSHYYPSPAPERL